VRVSLKGLQQAPHVTEFKYERITTSSISQSNLVRGLRHNGQDR